MHLFLLSSMVTTIAGLEQRCLQIIPDAYMTVSSCGQAVGVTAHSIHSCKLTRQLAYSPTERGQGCKAILDPCSLALLPMYRLYFSWY